MPPSKASLLQVSIPALMPVRGVTLLYTPEKVSRTVTASTADPEGGARRGAVGDAVRLRGPAAETIRMEAVIDAADQLEFPGLHPLESAVGISPHLAALEVLLNPSTAQIALTHGLAALGVLEILPMEAPLTVLVWGQGRVLPVRLTELTIEEQLFGPALHPIRATVSLSMNVLTAADLGLDHPGGAMHMAALGRMEVLAAQSMSQSIGSMLAQNALAALR